MDIVVRNKTLKNQNEIFNIHLIFARFGMNQALHLIYQTTHIDKKSENPELGKSGIGGPMPFMTPHNLLKHPIDLKMVPICSG